MHEDYVNNLPTMLFPLPFRILFPHRQWLRKTTREERERNISKGKEEKHKKPEEEICMKTERRTLRKESE